MLLARICEGEGHPAETAAYIEGKLVPLPGVSTIAEILEAGSAGLARAERAAEQELAAGKGLSQDSVTYFSPTDPRVFLGLGYNYKALAMNEGVAFNPHPELFAKLPGCAIGHGAPVRVPAGIDKIDYEAELGVVIGRRASRVKADDALSYVGGYTACNDMTAKIIPRPQESGSIVVPLKCPDCFGPLGPVLVTADEVPDPHNLTMVCRVNGVEKQRFSTDDMVHSIPEIIEYITSRITLNAGDVITTGTSLGIGIIQTPPQFLAEGDVVEIEIEGYPPLQNRIEWEKG